MQHQTSVQALKAACIFTASAGVLMILAIFTPLVQGYNIFLDLVHMPLDGQQALTSDSEKVMTAIFGGLMLGLAVMTWQIVTLVYEEDPVKGARILKAGFISWFLLDSFGSYMAGAWMNVILNVGFLAMFIVPIMAVKTGKTAQAA